MSNLIPTFLSLFLSTTCSCRVYSYSFWIGLLIPFGIIYIINWVIFIHIFTSLVCRRSVRKETSTRAKLGKLKENFMIALGLSLLFGMGWAFGLLASSDLPPAVRYPAEWIFTLMAAFLGVYLFALYVLRSQEARKAWKRWLFCQCKRKPGVSSFNTPSRTRWETAASTVRSWGRRLTANRLMQASTTSSSIQTPNPLTTFNQPCSVSGEVGKITDINSSNAEPMSVMDPENATVAPYLPVEVELVNIVDQDKQCNKQDANPTPIFPSDLKTLDDSSAPSGANVVSSQADPNLPGIHMESTRV